MLQPTGSQGVRHDLATEVQQQQSFIKGFAGGSEVKNLPANAGDVGSIPGSCRSPGEGSSNPLQDSCLGHPMDRGAWRATVQGVAKDLDRT